MVGISSIISGLAAPISSVINKFVTRKEDQMRAQAEIEKIQKDFEAKVLDNQNNLLSAQKELVLAEVNGHWFQRNWRPALMWIIIAIIANNYLIAPIVNQIVTVFGGENIFCLLVLLKLRFEYLSKFKVLMFASLVFPLGVYPLTEISISPPYGLFDTLSS